MNHVRMRARRECQAAHFKEHKPFCKAMKLYEQLAADLPDRLRPKTPAQFYTQRINTRQALEPLLRRWGQSKTGRQYRNIDLKGHRCDFSV